MRKIIYLGIVSVVSFLCSNVTIAATEWDDEYIGRMVRVLRASGDKGALQAFLDRLPPSISSTGFSSAASGRTAEAEDVLRAALALRSDFVTLTAAQILGEHGPAVDRARISEIDLSGLELAQVEPIVAYMIAGPLPNLKALLLPRLGFEVLNNFIHHILDINKYISLVRIDARESGITEGILRDIFVHFSAYDYFVRDMTQISERYSCVGAFLTVDNTGIREFNTPDWVRGRKSSTDKTIYYRVESSPSSGPFIMVARR